MSTADDRPTRRGSVVLTAVVLAVLAAPAVVAIVHGVRGSSSDGVARAVPSSGAPSAAAPPSPSKSQSPSGSPSASRSAGRARSATCWDGSTAARVRACTEPTGTAGLAWVFPSIAGQRCGTATATGPAGTVLRQVCHAPLPGGGRALVVYSQWQTTADAARFLRGRGLRPEGGGGSSAARRFSGPGGQVGAAYPGAPFAYIVTLPAGTPSAALGQVVEARRASQLRGVSDR